jgi:hypothetical protein
MTVRFQEVMNRITGISTPFFGISWTPPVLDVEQARALITYLEDRRVLYGPVGEEDMLYSAESVLEIRQRLTADLEKLDRTSLLAQSISDMRSACRKFLDFTRDDIDLDWVHGFTMMMSFGTALGELRGIFGIHIARISAAYGIDVEEQLATILPNPNDDSE